MSRPSSIDLGQALIRAMLDAGGMAEASACAEVYDFPADAALPE
jgi:hypothetical protein